jgi:long-chain fatty acid transport protein
LGIARHTEFGVAQLKGSGSAWGVNVGVHGQITPHWSVGAHYLSEMTFKYEDADATFQQVSTGLQLAANNPITNVPTPVDALLEPQFTSDTGKLVAQKGSSRIAHPWQAQVGVGYTGFPGTTLSLDVARVGWSSFKRLPVTFQGPASGSNRSLIEDYKDIWAIRTGAEHVVQTPGRWQGWALRGGFSYAQTPAPDETVTPLLPDMNRRNFSLGAGIPLTPRFKLDASYLYVSTDSRRGRIVERSSATQTAAELNSGAYDLSAHVFSLSLTARF